MKRNGQQSVLVAALMMMAVTIASQAANSPLELRATSRNIPERGKVNAMQVRAGETQTSFIVPAGWRLGSATDGLVIQAEDYSATLTVKIGDEASLSTEKTRERISGTERTRVSQEFTWPTSLGQATVIDAESAAAKDLRLRTRTIVIASQGQTMQFNLTAKPADFKKHQKTLENLVASLRAE